MPGKLAGVGLLLLMAAVLSGCGAQARSRADAITGGSATRGASAISRYGCGSCHSIQGIVGANGLVGPPLTGIGQRLYVAGVLQNNTQNIESWIQHPTKIVPNTVMPDLGVTQQDALDIATYLYSLP